MKPLLDVLRPAGRLMAAPLGLIKHGLAPWAAVRERPNPYEGALISLSCVFLVMMVWWAMTAGPVNERLIDPSTLPSFTDALGSFPLLWFKRALARGAIWSLARVAGGFCLAAAVGIPLGIMAGCFLRVNAFLKPLSVFGRNVPIAALIPLTMYWFGIDELQKVMFIFLASLAFILFDSTSAVQGISDSYLDAAYTLGARYAPRQGLISALFMAAIYAGVFAAASLMLSKRPGADASSLYASWMIWQCIVATTGFVVGFILWYPILSNQVIRKVLMPLAMPDIVNSLRLLFGLAFGYIMLAETINATYGLGAIIITSQRQGPREHIYLVLIIVALLAFGIDRGILAAQRRLFPYRAAGEH